MGPGAPLRGAILPTPHRREGNSHASHLARKRNLGQRSRQPAQPNPEAFASHAGAQAAVTRIVEQYCAVNGHTPTPDFGGFPDEGGQIVFSEIYWIDVARLDLQP
jgi:hypothetical protein